MVAKPPARTSTCAGASRPGTRGWYAVGVFTAGGATSVYASAGLERCLRDVRTASQHITVHSNIFGLVGQALLGLDVSGTQFSIDDRGDGSTGQ